MPTGYTSRIADGISFEEFVMSCARGMGALIMMRDEPMDAPIPERFEPSDYHEKKLAEAQAELDRLKKITIDEADKQASIEFMEELDRHDKAMQNKAELRQKYESMLAQVNAWHPPSQDHEGFKKFMIEQITGSIEFDCDESHYIENPPMRMSAVDWLNKKVANAFRDVDYHRKGRDEEIARTEGRNIWIKKLRDSLVIP